MKFNYKIMKLPVNYEEISQSARNLVRKEYIRVQEGKCAHCNEPLDGSPTGQVAQAKINEDLFPRGFLDNPIHLHHDHDTGLTIGAVHGRCNAYLWEYLGE
jgi:hypothetical protein